MRWLMCLLLVGCFDFEEREIVLDLRAITAQADPPEIMVLVTEGDSEDQLFTVIQDPTPTTLRALVVNPQSPAPITASLHACLGNQDRYCLEEDGPIVELGRITGPPGVLEFTFEPSKEQLNAWLRADPFQGYGGLYIQVVFELEQPGFPPDRVSKLITYNVPFVPRGEDQDPPPPKVPNRNPRIDGLLVDGELRTEPMGLVVPPGQSIEIEPSFNREIAIETYPVINFPDVDTGELSYTVLTEKLEFQVYVTAGGLDGADIQTRTVLGEVEELITTYTAPDPYEGPVTLWYITRDDRGGLSWTEWAVRPE